MKRRTVLSSLFVSLLSAGCLSNPAQLVDNRPTASKRKEIGEFAAEVVEQTNHRPYREGEPAPPRGKDGNYKNTISVTFDCTTKTARFDGWLSTSSCRTVAIQSLEYDEESDRITVTLFPKWNNP